MPGLSFGHTDQGRGNQPPILRDLNEQKPVPSRLETLQRLPSTLLHFQGGLE